MQRALYGVWRSRDFFTAYGAPEIFSSDGAPQFTAKDLKKFLSDWGVAHRLSPAQYPQSNDRAELAMKSAKSILLDNTLSDSSLHNEHAARAIMQHRNTPL